MNLRVPRRRVLALGAAAVAGAGLAALGAERWLECDTDPVLPGGAAPVPIDPLQSQPTATATATVTATATSTPTPTPTATPTPVPTPPPRPQWSTAQMERVVYQVATDEPLVALTLDDGWSEREHVLDLLKAQKLSLTFFLAGNAIGSDRAFIAEALNAGMEIGNHTMTHGDLTKKTYAGVQQELLQFEALVAAAVPGATTKPYMRPPGGAVNPAVASAVAAAGYRAVNWSSSSGDGSASTTPDKMVEYALSRASPGAIILMHFGPRALVAIPPLVERLRPKGLEPVSLSRLFAAG